MSTFDDEFLADAAPEVLSTFGDPVTYHCPSGTVVDMTLRVRHLPSRTEERNSHRVRVESIEVLGYDEADGLGGVSDGAALDVDGDPVTSNYDFRDILRRSGGMITVLFERVTILETGTPQLADI